MANQAIGMIETKGYVAGLAAADAMVKAANVTIVGREEVGDGLMAVTIVCTWAFGLVRPTKGEVVLVLLLRHCFLRRCPSTLLPNLLRRCRARCRG